MYRRNIAAAAAVLFLSSAVGISAYAAPQKDNSATEAETETETETETQTETETETETQETEAATEREAGFVSIEEMPFEIETETETESSDQTETETETEQKIESPKVEQTFRFFQVEKKYAVSKRDDVYLYEKKNTKSDKVGKINALGVLHILEEDDDGEWYYVESGKARGFIKAKYVWADEKAERYVKHKKEKNIETAEVLKEAYENKAFLHTQTTAYKAVAKKKYALTKKRIKIYDSIPQEETKNNKKEETEKETQESTASESEKQSSSVPEGETQDNSAKESETPDSASGESETQESEKKKSTDQKSEKSEDTEKDQEPEVVGTLEKGGLCYILDDEDQEWSYVESDDVRGFVQTKQLETGKKVKKEIEEKYTDVKVVQVNYGDGEESIADMLKNTLETYPALKGIFCTNEDMADQTLDALADMENTEQIQIVGFDSGEKQQKAIQEGREYGTVTQNPYGLGYAAIVAAVRAIQGLPVDQKIDTGYQWLDKDTIDLETNQKYLYN